MAVLLGAAILSLLNEKVGASGLAPSPRPTGDAPGPTLWAGVRRSRLMPLYLPAQDHHKTLLRGCDMEFMPIFGKGD